MAKLGLAKMCAGRVGTSLQDGRDLVTPNRGPLSTHLTVPACSGADRHLVFIHTQMRFRLDLRRHDRLEAGTVGARQEEEAPTSRRERR